MASFSLPTRQGGLRDRNESRFVVFREACPWSAGSVQPNASRAADARGTHVIMTFGSTTGEIADFTKDKVSLATKMGQIGTRGDASLYAGLDAASKKMQQGKNPRKILLVLTSGNISPTDFGRSKEMIEKYKLPVHFIGLSVDCGPCEANPKNLAKLAAGTFGGLTKMEGQRYTAIPAFQALLDVLNK